jgi:hypothetical protein
MRSSLTAPPVRKEPKDSALYGRQLSLVRFCAAIAMLLITIAIFFAQNGSGASSVRDAGPSREVPSGKPLP